MKFLAIEKEISKSDFQPYLKAEAARVWDLYRAGIVREMYFHRDDHLAVIVLECASDIEAQTVLNSLPLVQQGLITFDVLPLIPYDGFSRLFAPSQ